MGEVGERVGSEPFLVDGKLYLFRMGRHLASDASLLAHLAPRQGAIDLVERNVAVGQEALERERSVADLVVGGYLLDDSASVETAQIAVDVGKDLLFGLFLQDDLATEGRMVKPPSISSLMLRECRPMRASKRSL